MQLGTEGEGERSGLGGGVVEAQPAAIVAPASAAMERSSRDIRARSLRRAGQRQRLRHFFSNMSQSSTGHHAGRAVSVGAGGGAADVLAVGGGCVFG